MESTLEPHGISESLGTAELPDIDAQGKVDGLIGALNRVIIGKEKAIQCALSCLLAQGHVLIDGLPGEGKTTLVQSLAAVLGLSYRRIQFTNDLLPSDILGVSMYSRENECFVFHGGPIFTQFLMADEINRASPKTQSALLEAMAERQVTIDGETRQLPSPFSVVATQNPMDQVGTHPLPESQLDRFLICIRLGYMDRESERSVLTGQDRQSLIKEIGAVVSPIEFLQLQQVVKQQHCADPVYEYLLNIAEFSRHSTHFTHGLSSRSLVGMLSIAKAYALIQKRDYVLPDDIQALLPSVIDHRLTLRVPDNVLPSEIILSHVAVS